MNWLFWKNQNETDIDYGAPYIEPWVEQAIQDFEHQLRNAGRNVVRLSRYALEECIARDQGKARKS